MLNPSTIWHGRSVRDQLLIVIGIVNLLAALTAGAVWILNTRSATRVEIEASLEVAQGFANATIQDLASQGRLDQLSDRLLDELRNLRHVRLLLMADGKLTMLAPSTSDGQHVSRWAPKWFAALVQPDMSGRSIRVISASRADPVIVIGEPADEIAEAWRDFASLAIIWLTLNSLVIGLLYVVLGRVLDPLSSLARGMQSLKGGRYTTRLEPSRVKEIALITDRFNGLAGNLDSAREETSQLYRRLIARQEQVRREIAHELHDEAGACLFGIAANASSIKSFVDRVEDEHSTEIDDHVGEILNETDRLKAMNRAILKQLRPGPIGQVELSQLIKELVSDLQSAHLASHILVTVDGLARSYGEAIDLTLYRCIQEGATAALRKGNAKTVYINIAEVSERRKGHPILRATLRFDGTRLSTPKSKDLTIATMAERVRAMSGTCAVKNSKASGTTIRIDIPIKRTALAASSLELAGGSS